ncbi:MAG TPA: hypothetical protein VEV83_03715 [Parafilimonas sp.]|nr:hypothetical protein [Parafilimonas sp.]
MCSCYAQPSPKNKEIKCDAKIEREYTDGPASIAFIHLHANETTALNAVRQFLERNKGSLFYVKQREARNVSLVIHDSIFQFDPNRMFTRAGRKANLNPYSVTADSAVKMFASEIVSQLHSYRIVISLHNNTSSNFSISSYKKGGEFESEASRVYMNRKMDEDDFVFTTDENIFNKCRKQKLNVVLQDNVRRTDDGSLSVYCANVKLSYVNIEAEFGHADQQLKMLEFIYQVVSAGSEERSYAAEKSGE